MTYPPALPAPSGPDERRAAFYKEAAGAFEFLALWHSLDAKAQSALRDAIHAAAAESAARQAKKG